MQFVIYQRKMLASWLSQQKRDGILMILKMPRIQSSVRECSQHLNGDIFSHTPHSAQQSVVNSDSVVGFSCRVLTVCSMRILVGSDSTHGKKHHQDLRDKREKSASFRLLRSGRALCDSTKTPVQVLTRKLSF